MDQSEENSRCNKCLELLESIIDNEATPEEEKFFHSNIEKCKDCLERYELEKQVKLLLQRKIAKQPVPSGLAENIKAQILAQLN